MNNVNQIFILTTVPLKHQLDIPTLQITLFVNNEDESKVFQLLNELDNKLYHNDVVKMLKKLIKKNLFHVHQTFHDTTEILNYLCDELIDNDLATKAYKEDVFKREDSLSNLIYVWFCCSTFYRSMYQENHVFLY